MTATCWGNHQRRGRIYYIPQEYSRYDDTRFI